MRSGEKSCPQIRMLKVYGFLLRSQACATTSPWGGVGFIVIAGARIELVRVAKCQKTLERRLGPGMAVDQEIEALFGDGGKGETVLGGEGCKPEGGLVSLGVVYELA